MGKVRDFGFNELTGAKRTWQYDDTTGTITVNSFQDLEPYLDHAQSFQNSCRAWETKDSENGDSWRVASVPMHLAAKIRAETGVDMMNDDHLEDFCKLLNSRDYCRLRTIPGKI